MFDQGVMIPLTFLLFAFSILGLFSCTSTNGTRGIRFIDVVPVEPFPHEHQQKPIESDIEYEHEIILLSQMVVETWMRHVQGESMEEPDLSSLNAYVRRAYEEQHQRLSGQNGAPRTERRRTNHWCARL